VQQRGPAVIEPADRRSHFTGVVVAVTVDQLLSQVSQRAHLLMPWQHFRLQPLLNNNSIFATIGRIRFDESGFRFIVNQIEWSGFVGVVGSDVIVIHLRL